MLIIVLGAVLSYMLTCMYFNCNFIEHLLIVACFKFHYSGSWRCLDIGMLFIRLLSLALPLLETSRIIERCSRAGYRRRGWF